MAVYAVNDEGVLALKTMSAAVVDALDIIEKAVGNIRAVANDNTDTLGPHKSSLDEALETIASNIEKGAKPAKDVSDILEDVAATYEGIIANDRIRNSGSGN